MKNSDWLKTEMIDNWSKEKSIILEKVYDFHNNFPNSIKDTLKFKLDFLLLIKIYFIDLCFNSSNKTIQRGVFRFGGHPMVDLL